MALERLKDAGSIEAVSRAFESAAAGPAGQPDFVNAAVLLETELTPEILRARLRIFETELGRVRVADRYAPRPIDLDLVLYDRVVMDTAELTLPDPDLLFEPYLAATVAELDPSALHPVTREPLADVAARLGRTARLTPRPDIDLGGGSSTR